MVVCYWAHAAGPGQAVSETPAERSRTLYHSIRRHTIYTGCLTTASRWGRLLWPLLAGRMRLYRMGLSLLCGCSRWLLTSRNTASEAPWTVTNGSSLSSRSNQWTLKRTGQGRFQPGGNSAEAAAPLADDHIFRAQADSALLFDNLAISIGLTR